MTTDNTAMAELKKKLDTALMNAVKPSYDIHIQCPECKQEVTTDNGEWLLWCGEEHSAQILLDAARILSRLIGEIGPELDRRHARAYLYNDLRHKIITIITDGMKGE